MRWSQGQELTLHWLLPDDQGVNFDFDKWVCKCKTDGRGASFHWLLLPKEIDISEP